MSRFFENNVCMSLCHTFIAESLDIKILSQCHIKEKSDAKAGNKPI